MSALVEHAAVGLLIRGCPDPEGATLVNPVLWVNKNIQSISGGTGNLATCVIRGRIKNAPDGVDGFVHQVSLQDPLGKGTQMRFRLLEEPKTTVKRDLAQLFSPDPAGSVTKSWLLKNSNSYLGKGVTTFDLVGNNVPTVNQILWVENEAFRIDTVTPKFLNGLNAFTVDVTRGVLGSRDREHVVRPSQYVGDGRANGLTVTDRPDFDRFSFETEVHYFTLDGNTATPVEMWPRMTDGRPQPDGPAIEWIVSTVDLIGFLSKRKQKRSTLKLSHAITVLNVANGISVELPPNLPEGFSGGFGGNAPPGKIRIWFTPYEAERFFDRRFRLPFEDTLVPADVTEFGTRFCAYPSQAGRRIRPDILIKAGGYDWAFTLHKVDYQAGPEWNTALGRQYIYAEGFIWAFVQESGQMASIVDKPCPGYPKQLENDGTVSSSNSFIAPGLLPPAFQIIDENTGSTGQLLAPKRNPTLNMGWALYDQDPIRSKFGEEAPQVKLRITPIGMRPIELLQTLLLSGQGGGGNDTNFDLICGGLCPEVDPAFLNRGTASLTPISVDPRTTELLKLDQLLNNTENVPIDVSNFDLGVHLRRILRVNSLIASYAPGGLTFRQISAVQQGAVTALKQVTGPGRLVSTGQRAPAMKALTVRGGHHPLTLKYGWEQPIYLFDGGDIEEGEVVDVYPVGGALTPDQWFSGPMSVLVRVTFMMQRGSPPTYKVPTKRQRGGIYPGDACSWTDDNIPGPGGRGLPNRFGRWVATGRDFNPWNGDQQVTLMTDQVNEVQTADGQLGAALLVTRIGQNAAGNYCFQVQALTAASSSTIVDPLDVINSAFENLDYMRVICEDLHNPSAIDGTSRPGGLETYGLVISYNFADDRGIDAYGVIELAIDPAWIAAGYDPLLMVERRTYLVAPDFRGTPNIANQEIGPYGASNNNQIVVAPGEGNVEAAKPVVGLISIFDV